MEARDTSAKAVIAGELSAARFLARDVSLVYLPSISVLRTLRTLPKRARNRTKIFLAFADPVFDEGDKGSSKAAV